MGFQLMSEVDARLLQHAPHFTRCRVSALFRALIMHGWHDPCDLTSRVPGSTCGKNFSDRVQSAACAAQDLMACLMLVFECPLLLAPPHAGNHMSMLGFVCFSLTGVQHM